MLNVESIDRKLIDYAFFKRKKLSAYSECLTLLPDIIIEKLGDCVV